MAFASIRRLFHNRPKGVVYTPTTLQMEATECGAASLTMILAYYKLFLPLEKIREMSGVSRDGANAANLLKAARLLHCIAKGYRYSADRLREIEAPLIIHWEFNHFLVFEGIHGNNVYLNDPAIGHRIVPFNEFKTSYTGIALSIRPDESFVPQGRPYSVIKNIASKLLEERKAAIFVLITSILMIVPKLGTPAVNKVFLDEVMTGNRPDLLFNIGLILFGFIVFTLMLSFLRIWILTRWERKFTLSDSGKFFWHILKMPLIFFQQRSPSEVASRVEMVNSVAQVLTGQAATAVFDLAMAGFYILLLMQYNVKLTLIAIFFTAVNVAGFLFVRRSLLEKSMQSQQDLGKEFSVSIGGLSLIETLKANGSEDDFFGRWAGYHTKVNDNRQKIMLFALLLQFLPLISMGINTAMLMTVGGFDIMNGLMTVGVFLAFQNLMGTFMEPLSNLLNLGSSLQETETNLHRLEDVMNYKEDTLAFPEEEHPEFDHAQLWGDIELKELVFGYSKVREPLIENFNLHIKAGDWIALVGGTGCGKSTIVKIILGFYEEWSGELLFDGSRRRDVPVDVIHNSIASVDQDISLIAGTVEENITLFDNTIRHKDVIQAAMDACIYEDITELDGGFSYKVSEGGRNFSGGQRQRLEIARALATNPSILILDEATSALDTITEAKIIENIRRRGCTCIIVAHRLSTIRDCDQIVVIDDGKIIEQGRHDELIALDGEYAKLVKDKD